MTDVSAKITQNIVKVSLQSGLPVSYYDGRFYRKYEWDANTVDATPTEMLIDSERLTVGADEVWLFDIFVVATNSSTRATKTWKFEGGIKRDDSDNTSIVGTTNKEVPVNDSGTSAWDVDVSADDTNESLIITVTGEASTTIKWKASSSIIKIEL